MGEHSSRVRLSSLDTIVTVDGSKLHPDSFPFFQYYACDGFDDSQVTRTRILDSFSRFD